MNLGYSWWISYSAVLSVKFSSLLTRPGVSGSESGLWGNPRESEEARCPAEPAQQWVWVKFWTQGPQQYHPPKKTWFHGESMDLGAISSLFLVTSIWLMPAFLKLGVHLNTHTHRDILFFFSGFPHFKTPLIEHLEIRRCGSSSHFRPWMFDPSNP